MNSTYGSRYDTDVYVFQNWLCEIASVVDDSIEPDKFAFEKVQEKYDATDQQFLICNIGDVVRRVERFQNLLPRVKPFYAVKANDDLALIQLLADVGLNFDCASPSEIEKVMKCGVSPDRIIYANPCKLDSHLRFARDQGIKLMTFDCKDELYKIKEIYADATLLLRLRVNDESSRCRTSTKFGAEPYDVAKLIELALKLKLDLVGISFHIGSMCENADQARQAIAYSQEVYKVMLNFGKKMQILDIGGGFPGCKYDVVSFEEISEVISNALKEHFPESLKVQIIAEPARYFCTSAYDSILKVHTVKKNQICKNKGSKRRDQNEYSYYLNDGVFGIFSICCYGCGFERQPTIVKQTGCAETKLYHSRLWGPTCDPKDLILAECLLPKLRRGDWIRIDAVGSYSLPLQTRFNGFKETVVEYFIRQSDLTLTKKLVQAAKFRHKMQ